MKKYDAILVTGLGGPRDGNNPGKSLPLWVRNKLDYLIETYRQDPDLKTPVILLSAGTYHVTPVSDSSGRNIDESTGMLAYLEENGFDISLVYTEHSSYDTIGNAVFARLIFTDVRGWKRLGLLVNDFHSDRTEFVFNWVFGFPGDDYQVELIRYVDPKVNMLPEVKSRREWEQERLIWTINHIKKLNLNSFLELHQWFFRDHLNYSSKGEIDRLSHPNVTDRVNLECKQTY